MEICSLHPIKVLPPTPPRVNSGPLGFGGLSLAMAGLGATPRTKKPSREDQELSTPRAAARGRAKSRQREGEQGEPVPRGWARVPGSPTTPGKGRLVRRGPEELPGPGESGESVPARGKSLRGARGGLSWPC